MFVTSMGFTLISIKNDGRKGISCKTQASISCILIRWMCFYSPITKRKQIVARIHVHHIYGMNFKLRKMMEKKLLLWNQSINTMYPNKVNVFSTLNPKKNGVCYENPCTSHLWNELRSKEKMERKTFTTKLKHQYHAS